MKILIIRRDNIGDLILTTPLLSALRSRYPEAWIGLYTNDYAGGVLDNHPALDQVFIYRKLKHLQSHGWQRVLETCRTLWQRFQIRSALRDQQLDWVLLATPAEQPRTLILAQSFKPLKIAGFCDAAGNASLDCALDLASLNHLPESARVLQLLRAIDPQASIPEDAERQWPAHIAFPQAEVDALCREHPVLYRSAGKKRVAVHISARKPSQRWPVENLIELIRQLIRQQNEVVLLWSPGSENNPLHPGDDEKAAAIMQAFPESGAGTLIPVPTTTLRRLIAALSRCDGMICSDGGAMHIAAALHKPIVCLFGKSDTLRWRPWGVPYRLLQKESQDVKDIAVQEVLQAHGELASTIASA